MCHFNLLERACQVINCLESKPCSHYSPWIMDLKANLIRPIGLMLLKHYTTTTRCLDRMAKLHPQFLSRFPSMFPSRYYSQHPQSVGFWGHLAMWVKIFWTLAPFVEVL